jgi:hypothetical protein
MPKAITSSKRFSVFECIYRDAGNYKAFGELLLAGQHTDGDLHAIKSACESGRFFIAEQLASLLCIKSSTSLAAARPRTITSSTNFFNYVKRYPKNTAKLCGAWFPIWLKDFVKSTVIGSMPCHRIGE